MTTHTVRLYAGAAEAFGSQAASLDLPDGSTLADVTRHLSADNRRLADVLAVCTLLLDGSPAALDALLPSRASTIDALPPFAGG